LQNPQLKDFQEKFVPTFHGRFQYNTEAGVASAILLEYVQGHFLGDLNGPAIRKGSFYTCRRRHQLGIQKAINCSLVINRRRVLCSCASRQGVAVAPKTHEGPPIATVCTKNPVYGQSRSNCTREEPRISCSYQTHRHQTPFYTPTHRGGVDPIDLLPYGRYDRGHHDRSIGKGETQKIRQMDGIDNHNTITIRGQLPDWDASGRRENEGDTSSDTGDMRSGKDCELQRNWQRTQVGDLEF